MDYTFLRGYADLPIDGLPGFKWVRGGDNYVSYDYYTAAPNGKGSFGVHVTVSRADEALERMLDQVVQSIQFK